MLRLMILRSMLNELRTSIQKSSSVATSSGGRPLVAFAAALSDLGPDRDYYKVWWGGYGTMLRDRAAVLTLAAESGDASVDRERAYRVADDYLMALGYALLAWAWAASARAAGDEPDRGFAERKLEAMRFGIEWVLPEVEPHWRRVMDRSAALPWIGE